MRDGAAGPKVHAVQSVGKGVAAADARAGFGKNAAAAVARRGAILHERTGGNGDAKEFVADGGATDGAAGFLELHAADTVEIRGGIEDTDARLGEQAVVDVIDHDGVADHRRGFVAEDFEERDTAIAIAASGAFGDADLAIAGEADHAVGGCDAIHELGTLAGIETPKAVGIRGTVCEGGVAHSKTLDAEGGDAIDECRPIAGAEAEAAISNRNRSANVRAGTGVHAVVEIRDGGALFDYGTGAEQCAGPVLDDANVAKDRAGQIRSRYAVFAEIADRTIVDFYIGAAFGKDANAGSVSFGAREIESGQVETDIPGGNGNSVFVARICEIAREVIAARAADDVRDIGNRRARLELLEGLHDGRGRSGRCQVALGEKGRAAHQQGENENTT